MSTRRRRIVIGAAAAALLLVAYASPQHRAELHILAADKSDAHPRQLEAAVDFGVVAFSVLVTWSQRLAH